MSPVATANDCMHAFPASVYTSVPGPALLTTTEPLSGVVLGDVLNLPVSMTRVPLTGGDGVEQLLPDIFQVMVLDRLLAFTYTTVLLSEFAGQRMLVALPVEPSTLVLDETS